MTTKTQQCKMQQTRSSWLTAGRLIIAAVFLAGALFNVFVYHNSAESYYAVRGFRGSLRV